MSNRDSAKSVNHTSPIDRVPNSALVTTMRAVLFALLVFLTWSASFIFISSHEMVQLVIGQPSPRDIRAPRQITYISDIKTEDARNSAMALIEDVYIGPDMAIASTQVEAMESYTDYITTIRSDSLSTDAEKLALLAEIPELAITQVTATQLLELDDAAWDSVSIETLRVLDLIMREEIRPSQLASARNEIRRLITRDLVPAQQTIVTHLAQNMVTPNTFYDPEQTQANRKVARDAVEPVHWTIYKGESILREGEIVSALAYEKLGALGLLRDGWNLDSIASSLLLSALLIGAYMFYIAKCHPLLLLRPRRQLLLALCLVISGVTARLIIPGRTLLPYLFPAAAVTMLITVLIDGQLAMVTTAFVSILVGLNAPDPLPIVTYSLVGSLVGGLALWRMDNMGSFVAAALYVALANIVAVVAFHLRTQSYDAVGLLQLLAVAAINGALSSSLTFVAFALISRVFGITTSLQLLELARPTHPLFRQLLINAPGTYHHSIVVSNMAERAAEAIGADALLSRVGSYYHDVGKLVHPYYFAENQLDGENPHDDLDPQVSADIILSHTIDGLRLAKKHRLPERIASFMTEHHGTTLVTYFYRQATQNSESGDVDENDFRYGGPKPQSRETAIVMLADSIEAWVRANRPENKPQMERVIRQVINDRLVTGQLDECDLTLRDLDKIREAFFSVLQGIYHPRVPYPAKSQRRAKRASAK